MILGTNGTLQAKDPMCEKNTHYIHFYIDSPEAVNQCRNVRFATRVSHKANQNEELIGKIS